MVSISFASVLQQLMIFFLVRGIASTGKGRFYDTQTADELAEALDNILAMAKKSAIINDLAEQNQTGTRIAFGSARSPCPPWPSCISYSSSSALSAPLAVAVYHSFPRLRIKLMDRLRPFFVIGLCRLSLLSSLRAACPVIARLSRGESVSSVRLHDPHLVAGAAWSSQSGHDPRFVAVIEAGTIPHAAIPQDRSICLVERQPRRTDFQSVLSPSDGLKIRPKILP